LKIYEENGCHEWEITKFNKTCWSNFYLKGSINCNGKCRCTIQKSTTIEIECLPFPPDFKIKSFSDITYTAITVGCISMMLLIVITIYSCCIQNSIKISEPIAFV
jgi:hypothetical protein